jgi:YihY family inner membrane protein
VRAFDRLQRRHAPLAVPVAIVRKFADDHAANLAALIAYYGFFSLFPLLLILVTVLGYVLQGDPALSRRIVDSALGQFPVIGDDLQVRALHGNAAALAIGIAGALWAGLGIVLAGQRAMDEVWDVPLRARRDFLAARVRGLLSLVVLGMLNVVGTTALGLAVGAGTSLPVGVASVAGTVLLDLVLFWAVFRLLTTSAVATRHLLPGIVAAALGWALLQAVGGLYVDHVVRHANGTYGLFAIVIGLLSWLYVGAQLLLLSAEANVVRARQLWPRGLLEPATAADVKALRASARVEERREGEQVHVSFGSHDDAARLPDSRPGTRYGR